MMRKSIEGFTAEQKHFGKGIRYACGTWVYTVIIVKEDGDSVTYKPIDSDKEYKYERFER